MPFFATFASAIGVYCNEKPLTDVVRLILRSFVGGTAVKLLLPPVPGGLFITDKDGVFYPKVLYLK